MTSCTADNCADYNKQACANFAVHWMNNLLCKDEDIKQKIAAMCVVFPPFFSFFVFGYFFSYFAALLCRWLDSAAHESQSTQRCGDHSRFSKFSGSDALRVTAVVHPPSWVSAVIAILLSARPPAVGCLVPYTAVRYLPRSPSVAHAPRSWCSLSHVVVPYLPPRGDSVTAVPQFTCSGALGELNWKDAMLVPQRGC